jgi:hypothetical protein
VDWKANASVIWRRALTGIRVAASASLRIKHVNMAEKSVTQNPREVATKFGKYIDTFFAKGFEDGETVLADWMTHLDEVALYGPDDPLFPATSVKARSNSGFTVEGFTRHPWKTTEPVRKIVRIAFERAGQWFSGPIRSLMQNRYVFNPFWQFHNGVDGYGDWEERFNASARSFAQAVQSTDTALVLSFVFDRLYILRNQLIHGSATWNSAVNHSQVGDSAAILGFLMPVFIDIMMDNPDGDWGQPFYPVVE